MADYYADGLTTTRKEQGDYLPAINYGAKVSVIADVYTVPAGGIAAGKTIEMFKLPKDAWIVGGGMINSACGNSSTIAVGTSDNPAKYLAATSVSSASTSLVEVANTIAKKAGSRLQEDETVILTTGTGSLDAAAKVFVFFLVVMN